jgi:hypothetical protein
MGFIHNLFNHLTVTIVVLNVVPTELLYEPNNSPCYPNCIPMGYLWNKINTIGAFIVKNKSHRDVILVNVTCNTHISPEGRHFFLKT